MAIQKLKRAENINHSPIASQRKNNLSNLILRKDNLIEEMVDVLIVIMQFYLCSPDSVAKRFDSIFKSKMKRLDKRTKEHKKTLAIKSKSKKKKSAPKKVASKSKLPKTKFRKITLKK